MKSNELQLSKIESLKESLFQKEDLNSFSFNFHGVSIEFQSTSKELIPLLQNYIPKSWQGNIDPHNKLVIHHSSPPTHLKKNFDNESSSDVFHCYENFKKDEQLVAVQRDFVATVNKAQNHYRCLFEPVIDDGLHNFFRWMLSPLLLKRSKAMLHAAALIDDNKQAYLFLGPSGAGKTTITELGSPRLILSDDMNLVDFSRNKLTCAAGGVGGLYKPQVALDENFLVKRIFWLNQSTTNSISELSPLRQTQCMLSSMANLPWETFDKNAQAQTFDCAQAIIGLHNIQQLNFKKEAQVWNLIDSL